MKRIEKVKASKIGGGKLDVMFIIDCTGSM